MKTLKRIGLAAFFTLGVFGIVTYSSCSKDSNKCDKVTCLNGGTCDASSGICSCPTGYSGNTCETAWGDAFAGVFTANEACGSTASKPYQITITKNPSSPTQLLVVNLGNYNCTVGGTIQYTATLTSSTTFTIADNECGTQMNATGTLNPSNGQISITYTATYGATTDNCTATLSK